MAHMKVRVFEDPSISQCAYLEFERVWGIIEAGVRRGDAFYVVRERVLASEIPKISKTYGAVVAERVSKHVQWRSPNTMSKEAMEVYVGRPIARRIEQIRREHNGKLPWYHRLCLALTGMPL